MNISMLKCKIHRATVTEADLQYEGSISISPDLIEAAGLMVNEKVYIYNCNSGSRLSTYVLKGRPGQICLNGAAARHVQPGDLVIICSYCNLSMEEAKKHEPKVVFVDAKNRIKELRSENEKNNRKLSLVGKSKARGRSLDM